MGENESGRFVRPPGFFKNEQDGDESDSSSSDDSSDSSDEEMEREEPNNLINAKANMTALNLIPELKAKDWKEARMKWPNYKKLMISLLEMNSGLSQQQKYSILLAKGGVMVQKVAFDRPILSGETKASAGKVEPAFDNLIYRFEHHLKQHANFVIDIESFQEAKQEDSENMADYVARLQDLAKLCQFPDAELMIKAQILKGAKQKHELVKQSLVNELITVEKLEAFGSRLELFTQEFNKKPNEPATETIGALKGSRETDKNSRFNSQPSELRDRGYVTFNERRGESERYTSTPYTRQSRYSTNYSEARGNRFTYTCYKCGLDCRARGCPAKGNDCSKCGKSNHFARCCRSRNNERISQIEMERPKVKNDEDDLN